ncbi:MAG: L-histidine N(alpha)-methyltransferase [Candidatus Binatia bacterium]
MIDGTASSRLFSSEQKNSWRIAAPGIWSAVLERPHESPALSILTTLWDQPRWLEAYHLYDERGSELFERICELPEYYLTRTENSILEQEARRIIAAAPVEAIVELGAGSSKKTTHLLREQLHQRGRGIFAPIDVSLPGLVMSRDFVYANYPELEFHGLHALYEDGLSSIDQELPTLFVFLGSTIGNFNHTSLPRFFRRLSRSMGPNDFLLLGADRIKSVEMLEKAYDDSQGLTAEFILNVFRNVNRLLNSNFDLAKMRYQSRYNPEWQQIEMRAVADVTQEIEFRAYETSFRWERDEKILVEISRKFDPIRLQEQLNYFALAPVAHYSDRQEWFSLLLFKKAA